MPFADFIRGRRDWCIVMRRKGGLSSSSSFSLRGERGGPRYLIPWRKVAKRNFLHLGRRKKEGGELGILFHHCVVARRVHVERHPEHEIVSLSLIFNYNSWSWYNFHDLALKQFWGTSCSIKKWFSQLPKNRVTLTWQLPAFPQLFKTRPHARGKTIFERVSPFLKAATLQIDRRPGRAKRLYRGSIVTAPEMRGKGYCSCNLW